MPMTGHKAWVYRASASDFLTVTAIECQVNLNTNNQANRIDASHKNNDNKVFLAGSQEEIWDIATRFEASATDDPRVRETVQEALYGDYTSGATVYLELRVNPSKGATLANTDRFARRGGVLLSFNEAYPDEGPAELNMQYAANTTETL